MIVVDENYVLCIFDVLFLDVVVLLLCVGIMLYLLLCYWNVGVNMWVVIIGLGGLGYMGVKLGVVMGVDVMVLF